MLCAPLPGPQGLQSLQEGNVPQSTSTLGCPAPLKSTCPSVLCLLLLREALRLVLSQACSKLSPHRWAGLPRTRSLHCCMEPSNTGLEGRNPVCNSVPARNGSFPRPPHQLVPGTNRSLLWDMLVTEIRASPLASQIMKPQRKCQKQSLSSHQ